MGGNLIKLVFKTFTENSGLEKFGQGIKDSVTNMGQMSSAAKMLGMTVGGVFGGLGRLVGSLLHGGVWGIATQGIAELVDHFDLFGKKAEETRKKNEELAEAARRAYDAVNQSAARAIENIGKELQARKAISDVIDRQYKAELQLQRAEALRSGDLAKAQNIERVLAETDRQSSVDRADAEATAAEKKVAEAKRALDLAQKRARDAGRREADAERALIEAEKPRQVATYYGNGAVRYHTEQRVDKDKRAQLITARKDVEAADVAVENAKRAYDLEVEKWRVAKENAKAVAKEQEAAAEREFAERFAAEKKADEERNKAERKRLVEQQKREAENRKREEYEAKTAELELERQRRIASGESKDAVNDDIDNRLAELAAAEKLRIAKASQLKEPEKLRKAKEPEKLRKAEEPEKLRKAEAEIEAERLKRSIATEERKRRIRLETEREMLQNALDANTERANDLREKLKNAQQAAAVAAAGFGGTLPGGRGVLGLGAPGDLKDERQQRHQEEANNLRLANAAIRLQERNPNWRNARNLSRQDEQARRWLLAKENERKIAEEQRRIERERRKQAKDISDILTLLKQNVGL